MQLRSPAPPDGNDPILCAQEIAHELRCSTAHVYNVILGKVTGVSPIPVIRLGRRKIVRRSSFEAWKRANESGLKQRQPAEMHV